MTNDIINMLEMYFPFVAEDAEEYIKVGIFELIIKMKNGRSILYDNIDHTIRNLPKDSSKMTEVEHRKELSFRLRKIMRHRGMTQNELADATGLSRYTVNRYLNGKVTPSFYHIDKIAKALDCSVDDFRYFY